MRTRRANEHGMGMVRGVGMAMLASLCLGWLSAMGAGVESDAGSKVSRVGEARGALDKWVEARQMIGQLKNQWAADKETLEAQIALFEAELEGLEKKSTVLLATNSAVAKDHQELNKEKASLLRASEKVAELTTGLEKQLLALTNALPEPLLSKLADTLAKVPADPKETKRSVQERLLTVVSTLNEIEKFNGVVTIEPEVQTNSSGEKLQVTKIYLGLGQAFFMDEKGTYAGVGIPSLSGWEWVTKNELAPTIRRVMAIYDNAEPAAFVGLPVQIK